MIDFEQPFFGITKGRNDALNYGRQRLHQTIQHSEQVLRQIKNGQIIFNNDDNRMEYTNPYFKNRVMHKKLMDMLERRKPSLSPNPNINAFEADKFPLP